MRKFYLLVISCLFFITEIFSQQQNKSFDQSGTYYWTVPCGVTSINVQAWGSGAGGNAGVGGGGGGGGGGGAFAGRNNISVTPGSIYTIIVGEGAGRGSGDDGEFSRFRLNATDIVTAEGGGYGSGNRSGGQASNSIGTIKYSGGNGGASASGRGGAGGGGSAGNVQDGGNGNSNNGDNGGAAGFGGDNGGMSGGKGGSRNQSGFDAVSPGSGGGERGSSGSSSGAGGDGMVIISYVGMADYCTPQFGNTEPITLVNLDGQIDNSTSASKSSPGYEPFCLTANVARGNNYAIKVKGNTDGNYYSYFTVFIDWNQDGDFNDANEIYKIGTIKNSNGTNDGIELNASILVPAGATLGLTKMRVYKTYGSGNNYDASKFEDNACDNNTYGQVEDYTVNVIGTCVQPTGATVTDGTNSSSTSLTVCSGTKVTLKQTGGTKGTGTWEWRFGSATGTLVGTSNALDAELEITPSVGTTTYYVHSTCGAGSSASITVIVNTNGTIVLFSGTKDIADACKGTAITPIVFSVGGGAGSASVTAGNFTASGLSGTYNSSTKRFTISGTPTVAGTFTYTVTTSGNSPCSNESISGTITVNQGPASLSYTLNTVIYCSGGPITANQPTVTGGAATSYSVSPALPYGLVLNTTTGIITGTPTVVSASFPYSVIATNSCGTATRVLYITISNGDQAFNVTPSGNQNICSGSNIPVGLDGSVLGTSYQLFRNGSTVGTPVAGTGNAIVFGNQTIAGTYTVKSTSSCATNMIGSAVINVTPVPTTTFTYSTYNYCRTGSTSAAILAGSPATGTFTSSPVGLVFFDASTGVIDLAASLKGDYTIAYTVAATGGCSSYTYTQANKISIVTTADVYSVTGGGEYCAGTGGVAVGLENSQTSVSYQLYRNATILVGTYAGTGAALNFGNQTIAGTYTVIAKLGSCSQPMDGEAEVIMNPVPATIKITPSTATLCQGSIIPLTASLSTESVVTSTVTASSGNINLSIPNSSASGAFTVLKVDGIPDGATITGVSINFRISHNTVGDLVINLKGPNGNVLNIANTIGGNGNNYGSGTNYTFVDNSSINNITTASAPFNASPYSPQAAGAVAGATLVSGNTSNTGTFSGLYGAAAASAKGNWILSVRDNAGGNSGTLNNCEIVISYTMVNNPTSVTWSPATDLYTDPGATIPYIGGANASTLYAKPSVTGNIPYTATVTNAFGCSTTASTTLTVNASPVITISADYCNYPSVVRIIAQSNIDIDSWIWSTGGAPGTNKRSTFIDVNVAGNYFVSAKATGNNCPGSAVMSIAQELVVNGNFELGKVGFESDYYYQDDVAGNTELWDHFANNTTNGYGIGTNGQNYHSMFWGIDHTYGTGDGKFMIVNGHGSLVAWKNENVTVLPNTTYYFSGWGMSINQASPFAKLKFVIDGDGVYNDNFTANLVAGVNDNSNNGWQKFYGKWTSGPTTTSVNISIVNLETSLPGNDFALDDISFGTLSTFFNLTSAVSTTTQLGMCEGKPITDITYEVGGDGNPPTVSSGSFPPGINSYWNGRNFRLNGTPTTPGTYNFTLQSSGCNPKIQNVKIEVIAASNAGTFVSAPLLSVCYNSGGTIALTGTVGTLQWQTSTDNATWSNVANGIFSNLQSTAYYRVTAKNSACDEQTSTSIKLGVKKLWVGKTNDNWNTATNWSDEATPSTSCDDVIIPQVASNRYPILNSGYTSVKNIIIGANASVTVFGTGTMQIAGTITKNASGIFDVKDGSLDFNGTVSQSLSGAGLKDKTIKNLIVSNTSATGLIVSNVANDTLNVVGALTFGTTSSKLNSGDNITLKSSADATASIGKLAAGNIITGNFVVERFINTGKAAQGGHRKSWQLLATPTTGQSIKDSWQEGATSTGTTPIVNHKSGYGTLLTSGLSNAVAAGFDLYTAPGPSMKSYNSITGNFDNGAASTSLPLYNPNGYMILVRGDRSVYIYNQEANATVLRSKGKLFTAQAGNTPLTINVLAQTFTSVGNPYASAIDLRKITRTGGVDEFIYVWDPLLSGGYGLGAYVTLYKNLDGNYYATPSNGSYEAGPHNFIQSGQAFFVQSTGTNSGTVSFTEDVKASGSKLLMRPMGTSGKSAQLQTNLYGVAADGKAFIADGALVQYSDDFSNAIDGMDARKATNTSENLSILSMGKKLAVERRHTITAEDTIFLTLNSVQVQPYRYEFVAENLSAPGLEGWIEDSYLKTRTPLNLEGATVINFKIENIPGAYAANRFRIVFKQAKEESTLAVIYASIKANQQNDDINVEWKVENETVTKHYEVQRSEDGISFTTVATVPARNRQTGTYNWLDKKPLSGYNYYRVRAVDINGLIGYTQIVKVKMEIAVGSISIYPNPITNGIVNLQLTNQPSGLYYIKLTNPIGQTIMSKKIAHTEGSSTEKIKWDYKLAHGMYQMEITKPSGDVHVIKVMY